MSYRKDSFHDKITFYFLALPVLIIVFILLTLIFIQVYYSFPVLSVQGIAGTYFSNEWRAEMGAPPPESSYGILSALWGTLYVALIAIAIDLPLAIALVIFIEEILPKRLREYMTSIVDLMAGMPTIIFGVWGLRFLGPFLMDNVMKPLHELAGFLPLFNCAPFFPATIFTAAVLMAALSLPFMVAVIQESYRSIPVTYKEAAWSLGLTRYEYVRLNLSMISPAIISAVLLGFGRASSETAAVSLVIGNVRSLDLCVFRPGYTISALIANQFHDSNLYPYMLSALYAGGLILLVAGLIINVVGITLLRRIRF